MLFRSDPSYTFSSKTGLSAKQAEMGKRRSLSIIKDQTRLIKDIDGEITSLQNERNRWTTPDTNTNPDWAKKEQTADSLDKVKRIDAEISSLQEEKRVAQQEIDTHQKILDAASTSQSDTVWNKLTTAIKEFFGLTPRLQHGNVMLELSEAFGAGSGFS